MADKKDPFAEFGGSLVAKDKDPFAEFGGSKLGGKPLDTDLPTGTQTSKRGFEPFLPQVPTKAPSVLTPKGQVGYQEQVKDFKPIVQKPIFESPKAKQQRESGYENIAPLLSGLQSTVSSFYKIPRYIYDVFAIPQNLVADLANVPELKANYDNVSKGALNPLSYLEYAGDYTKGKAKEWESKQRKYDEDITTQLFKSGDYGGAGLQIYDNVIASAPSIAAMFLSGGVANAAKLGSASSKIATALPFASAQNQELLENQEIPDWLKPVNAAFNGLSEILLEGKFGTTAILSGATKIAAEKGADAAIKSTKDFVYNYIKKALSKVQPVTDVVSNAAEEMATTLSQNIIARATGEDPNRGIMDGVFDAGIVGGAQGAGASAIRKGLDVLANKKSKGKVDDLTKKRDDIVNDLDNDAIPDAVKEQLEISLEGINQEINNTLDENRNEINNLPEETKLEVAELADKIETIKESLQNETISETSKAILEQDLKNAQAELDAKFKLAKPTFDTEAQIIAEGQQAEADFQATDDQVTYEQKMKELEDRAKNLVPAPEDAEIGEPRQEAEVTAPEIEKPRSIRLNFSEEGLAKMEGKEQKDVYPTRQFFENKPNNVGLPEPDSSQFTPFTSENKDNTKEETVDLSEITPTQELVDKSGIGGKLTVGNPKLVRFNDGLFVLDGHHRIATEAIKGNDKIKADVTTIDMTSDQWGEQKINKFLREQEATPKDKKQTPAQQEEQLRAEEQADGEIDVDKLSVNDQGLVPKKESGLYNLFVGLGNKKEIKYSELTRKIDGQYVYYVLNQVGEKKTIEYLESKGIQIKEKPKEKQTPAQEVKQLRAEEQAEIKAAIPNADQYLTDGNVDRDKITDAKDLKKFDEIYDKYDKLITLKLKEAKAEPTPAKPKATKLKAKVDTRLKFKELSDLSTKINEAVKGSAKRKRLIGDRNLLLEKFPIIKYVYENIQNITKQLIQKGIITKDKDKDKVTYNGVNYSSDEFSSLLHDGLLDQQVNDNVIDDSNFSKKPEMVEKTEFDSEEEAELYAISRETDPNVIAAKYFTSPTLEESSSPKDLFLMWHFLGKKSSKINESDWAEYNDLNNLTPEIRKKYIDSTNKSGRLDTEALSYEENEGISFAPEDFINFILDYGSAKGFKSKKVSNVQQALLERYFELTGRKQITDAAAKKGFDAFAQKNKITEKRYTQKQRLEEAGITEEDIAKEQEFAKEGFGEDLTSLEKFEYQKKQISKKGKTELEIKKEAFEKAKEMVAAIRGLKIDGKGKAFDATLGLPVAIWNGALETVASAIEAGVSVADAIKRGLNYIQKNNRGAWNKKAYNDRVIEALGLRGIEVNGEDLIVRPLEDKATVELVNGFYSPLEKGIAEAKTDKATGKGWMKVLSGVTEADELKYTGVKDFLDRNADRPISRKELLDYMKNNRIEVVEIVYSETLVINKDSIYAKDKVLLDAVKRAESRDDFEMLLSNEENLYKHVFNTYGADARSYLITDDLLGATSGTKFSKLQLEGEKENYKEVLVTLPSNANKSKLSQVEFYKKEGVPTESEQFDLLSEEAQNNIYQKWLNYENEYHSKNITEQKNEFKSTHFDEKNILVHLRMNTRTDAQGNKVLFLEEVQSDWGQKGKKEGFKGEELDPANLTFKVTPEGTFNLYQLYDKNGNLVFELPASKSKGDNVFTKESLRQEFKGSQAIELMGKTTPTAPFVTDTNAWTKLGLKVALKEAIAQGATKIAWTTGEQQNDRYDLSKQVESIEVSNQGEGVGYKVVGMKDGNVAMTQIATAQQLPDVIGKELAQKIIDAKIPYQKTKVFSGLDLKVGGKGMKGFYGNPTDGSIGIVGGVAEKLFGQKVGTVEIELQKQDVKLSSQNFDMSEAPKELQDLVEKYSEGIQDGDYAELKKLSDEAKLIGYEIDYELDGEITTFKRVSGKPILSTQYSIDITPELKQAVKEGIPLFKSELTQAKEKLKEASAALSKLNKNLGIYSDPEQKAKALFEYHKALVGVAKAYIKEIVKLGLVNVKPDIKEFAKSIGESVTQEVKDAWNEAKGISKKTLSDFKAEAEKVQAKEEKERLRQEEERLVEIEKEKLRGEVSGIKKALVSDKIIESVNLDKISDKEMLELGKELVETGEIKPDQITLSIAKGSPRALQPKEVVALIYYKATLDNKRRELLSEYNKFLEQGESIVDTALELDKIQTDIDLYDTMSVITANQQSLAFRLRKGLLDKDYNLVTQIEQYKKVNDGVIPAEVEKRFRELDKQLTELKDKLREAEQRAIEAEEKKSVKNIEEDVKRSNSSKNRNSLTPQEKARKKELANKYRVFNDISRIITILAEKDFREYAGLVLKEVKGDFVEFGRQLIQTVGNDIKDFLPKLYKDLGGKGETNISDLTQKPFVKDGVLVIPPAYIRDAVENGITEIDALAEAVKREVEVDLPNVTIRAVRDAITQYGRTVNQTKDTVQRQINEAKRLGRLYSELEDLQNRKKKEISGKVYNKMSDKERELKRNIKILEKNIPPTAEEVEQKKEQRANLRKEYLKRYIQEKKERLNTGNFAPKSKPLPVRKDSEIIALETEANKIRDEYDAAHYDNEQANRSTGKKILDGLKELGTGISRALVAGLDFGFFLVQGIISVTSSNPLKTGYAVKQSFLSGLGTDVSPITETRKFFRELGSEKIERELLANLKAQPYYPIIKASGVAIQEPSAKLGERDDALQASVINKIWNFIVSPLKFVSPSVYETAVRINPYRASERAYTGASNAIRVQLFLDFVQELENKGITYEQSPELYKIAANTANNMTFRGRLRAAEPIAAELNVLFFSARKVAASLSLVNPAYWVDLAIRNPVVAKQAMLKMATFIGVATSITLALQAFSDDEEEEQNPDMFNPYSSDFMTYRIGNTRLNFFGGLGGNVVLFARFIMGNYKTTSSSKIKKLGQDSFTPNRKELLETTLFANKLSPTAGVGYAFLNQSVGREIDWESEAVSSVTPIWAQNISELSREHPETMAKFLSFISFLGQSVNTYGTPEFIDRKKDKELFDLIQLKNASFSEKKRVDVDVIDINTGESREITKEEFETFKKEYGDYIKNQLKSNYKELYKMPVQQFEKEMAKIKSNATSYAKEQVTNVIPETLTLEIDNVTYKLTPDKVAERKEYIQEYIDENEDKSSFEIKIENLIEKGSIKDTPTEIKKILMSDAKEYATKKMKKEYKDNPDELGVIED